MRLTLPAQRRLRRKADFEAAYARGRRFGNGFFPVTVYCNSLGWPRLGLAVSVRAAGAAGQRNRIRRIVLPSFPLHHDEIPALDLAARGRPQARAAPRPQLRASLTAPGKK